MEVLLIIVSVVILFFLALYSMANTTDDKESIIESIEAQRQQMREQSIQTNVTTKTLFKNKVFKYFLSIAMIFIFSWLLNWMWLENEKSKSDYYANPYFDPNDPEAFYIRPDYSNLDGKQMARKTAEFMRTEEYKSFTDEQKKILRGKFVPDFETAVNIFDRHRLNNATKIGTIPIWLILSILASIVVTLIMYLRQKLKK